MARSRFIRAYTMHGHAGQALFDYDDFFRWIAATPPPATQVSVTRDLDIAIERVLYDLPFVDFRFVSGNPKASSLVYNQRTGKTERPPVAPGSWPAEPTRATAVPHKRLFLIESRRQGVGVATLEDYFENLARINRYAPLLKLRFSRVPSADFEEEINRLVRIRSADLEVIRPNTDWDDANNVLSELADESHGEKARIAVSAGRGDSLSRTTGIISLIRSHVRMALTNVSNARVVGRREGDQKDITVSLENHQLRTQVVVDERASEVDQDSTIFAEAHRLAVIAQSLAVDVTASSVDAVDTADDGDEMS